MQHEAWQREGFIIKQLIIGYKSINLQILEKIQKDVTHCYHDTHVLCCTYTYIFSTLQVQVKLMLPLVFDYGDGSHIGKLAETFTQKKM